MKNKLYNLSHLSIHECHDHDMADGGCAEQPGDEDHLPLPGADVAQPGQDLVLLLGGGGGHGDTATGGTLLPLLHKFRSVLLCVMR